MAPALSEIRGPRVARSVAGVVGAESPQAILERDFLLAGCGLAAVQRTEGLHFGLGVVGSGERVLLRDALSDRFFQQLRGGPLEFLGLREFPCRCSGFSGDGSLFLGCGLTCVFVDDLGSIRLGADMLGLHTDALEGRTEC